MFVDYVEVVRFRVPELNRAIEEHILSRAALRARRDLQAERRSLRPPVFHHPAENTA